MNESTANIRLHNTLSGKTEVFTPLTPGTISMYHCGPTVYNYFTVGNLRSYLMADLLRRTFEANGYKVKQVINITDVGHLSSKTDEGLDDDGEDKVEKMASKTGKTAAEITEFYTGIFFDDIRDLNIKTEGTLFPRATEHINEQITMIEKLEKSGHTYMASDGIYFDTSTFPDYGKLGHIDIKGLVEGARIEINPEKRNPTDFALWKFSPKGEKRFQEWESPWGVGFPGWHIECSAMSEKYLGKTFDIHTGGIDHIPVHHNNEIAQSESANNVPLARYWIHNAFVNVQEGKMSKSKENFIRLQTLKDEGLSPISYRYWLMNARYSSPVQFSIEAVKAADQGLKRLIDHLSKLEDGGKTDQVSYDRFLSYMNDDLDTPKAIAFIWEILKNPDLSQGDKKSTILSCGEVLGLNLEKQIALHNESVRKSQEIPENIIELAEKRKIARQNKDWPASDELRSQIEEEGFEVKDVDQESYVIKKI